MAHIYNIHSNKYTMSLDLFIKSKTPIKKTGTGVYIRENGRTRELKTKEEVLCYFGNSDGVDVNVYETDEIWHENMTHNLGNIASKIKGKERNLYTLLWRPTENKVTKDWVTEILRCYTYMMEHEDELRPLEEENRIHESNGNSYIWGTYNLLKEFMESLVRCLLDLPYEREDYILISDV